MTLDRTQEFESCVKSFLRAQKANPTSSVPAKEPKKSAFHRQAQAITQSIHETSSKLQRLAQLCTKKSIFDDHTTAIQELTYIIKQDLSQITDSVKQLQSLKSSEISSSQSTKSNQKGMHVEAIVGSLNKGVNSATKSFKDILEIRTKNMRESKNRSDNFVHYGGTSINEGIRRRGGTDSVGPSHLQNFQNSQSPLNPARSSSAPPVSPNMEKSQFLSLSLEDDDSQANRHSENPFSTYQQEQQQSLIQQDSTALYLESRSTAIQTIESTISELGGIFQQLAEMVSMQGETIQRIDENTDDVVMNVDSAQREIEKYFKRVMGNRWLLIKIFGVLIVFFLLFVVLR